MATEFKFPQLVLEAGDHRLVAIGLTKQAAGKVDGHHCPSYVNGHNVDIVSERRETDSLGREVWVPSSFEVAQRAIVDQLIRDALSTTVPVVAKKNTKQS